MTHESDSGDAGVVEHGHRGDVDDGEDDCHQLHHDQGAGNHQLGSGGHEPGSVGDHLLDCEYSGNPVSLGGESCIY